MELPDARLSAIFAATFVIIYVVWKFVQDTRVSIQASRRPPCIWSLPFIGSMLFLPDYRLWHKEFLKMSAKIGNVFSFYVGSQYVCVVHSAGRVS